MSDKTANRRITIYINGKEVENNIKSIRGEYFKLINAQAKMTRGSKEYVEAGKEIKRLDGIMGEHRKQLKNVESGWGKAISGIKGFLPVLSLGAAAAGIKKLFDFQQELEKTRLKVTKLTGATGAMLNNITAGVQATANTFDKDFDEVLNVTNGFAKQMGIGFDKSLKLIQNGFITGADSSGEFLNILKEYPAQFKAAGLSAEESIALITQQVKEGVYSDKGVDTIKEGTLRLREMTTATREAIDGIGISSAQMEKDLRAGNITYFEAMQQISKKLGELPPQASEVGTAIADIFGGPGEDAGLNYIKTLQNINLNLDSTNQNLTEVEQRQKDLLDVNTEIEKSYNMVFGSADGWVAKLKLSFKQFFATILEGILTVDQVKKMVNEDIMSSTFASDREEWEKNQKAFFDSLATQIEMDKQRLESGVKNIDQLKLEKEMLGEVRSAAIELNEEERKNIQKRLDMNKLRVAEAKKTIELEKLQNSSKIVDTGKTNFEKETDKKDQKKLEELQKEYLKKEEELKNKIMDIRKQLNLEKLSEDEKEIQQVRNKYAELLKEAEGHKERIVELEKLQSEEIIALQVSQEEKKAKQREEVMQRLGEALKSEKQIEYENTRDKYLELIQLAEQFGIDTTALFQKLEEALDAFKETAPEKNIFKLVFNMSDEDFEKLQQNIDIAFAAADQIGAIWSNMNEIQNNKDQQQLAEEQKNADRRKEMLKERLDKGLISEQSYNKKVEAIDADMDKKKKKIAKEQAVRDKNLRKFEAVLNMAAAIIGFLVNPGGFAGVALSIMAGITGATQIEAINSTPIPEFSKGGATKGIGLLDSNNKEIAGVVHPNEYVIPAWMMKMPKVANTVGALEAIRTRKGFAEGGSTSTTNVANNYYTTATSDPALAEILNEMKMLRQYMSDPVNRQAIISNDLIQKNTNELNLLNSLATIK